MKTLTNKNKIKFESKEEMEKHIEENELILLAAIGRYYDAHSYISHHTHVNNGYIYNFYVCRELNLRLIKHLKLKIYHQENGGYYVLSQGQKCWINTFWDRKNEVFRTGEQAIQILKEERGM